MINSAEQAVGATTYPGRGIIVGKSQDGARAVMAYFIMGRSINSRNRIFVGTEDGIRTQAFDPALVKDPSLIIYAPVREINNNVIITNGDQTDTVYDFLFKGQGFEDALNTRCFEPDAPNYTPRISALVTFNENDFALKMNILRAGDKLGKSCTRVNWAYENVNAGEGHFLHTYMGDGMPIPSFVGDPEIVNIGNDDARELANKLWDGLNADNRVSLWVQTRDLATGETDIAVINRNI